MAVEETRDLRARVLRPGQPIRRSHYREDANPDSGHFGAFDMDGTLVGCGSIYPQAHPDGRDGGGPSGAWRVRGMAVEATWQRRGVGAALLAACLDHAAARGAHLIWMQARTPAAPFYRAQGFRLGGDEFEIPHLGPHLLMERALPGGTGTAGAGPAGVR